MAGQHWGEHGDPDEPISLRDRTIEWLGVGCSMLAFAGQIWCLIALITSR
jgi:hypothetical protein